MNVAAAHNTTDTSENIEISNMPTISMEDKSAASSINILNLLLG